MTDTLKLTSNIVIGSEPANGGQRFQATVEAHGNRKKVLPGLHTTAAGALAAAEAFCLRMRWVRS
jgi:hypothetical protein